MSRYNMIGISILVLTLMNYSPSILGAIDLQSEIESVFADVSPPLVAKKAKKRPRRKRQVESSKRRPKEGRLRALASAKRVGMNARVHRYRANMAIGVNIVKGSSALSMGGQFGYAFWDKTPVYIGPEVSFSLNSPGSLISVLGGAWYEVKIHRTPRMGLAGGVLAGMAIPSSHPTVKSASIAAFLDTAISQEVNDLVSVRGQFRPGFIGSHFAFMMNFNVAFRFP